MNWLLTTVEVIPDVLLPWVPGFLLVPILMGTWLVLLGLGMMCSSDADYENKRKLV